MISPEMIQAFLSIVEHGNMTSAAAHMFTTQSSLSKQIQALEEETGVQLLIRRKGHSSVALTPAGQEFLRLAGNWQSLMKEFGEIRSRESITEVSVGALDRINTFTLKGFYRSVLKNHPQIRLDTHTRHSREIYSMMESGQLDLGLATGLLPANHITASLIYYEPLMAVCSEGTELYGTISPSDLDPSKEVYSRWSDEFEIWHDQYWPSKRYRIHIGTVSMAPEYLKEPGWWSIMPVSILHEMTEAYHLRVCTLSTEPPKRGVYLLEQKNPRESRQDAVHLIRDELLGYLKKDPYIEMI